MCMDACVTAHAMPSHTPRPRCVLPKHAHTNTHTHTHIHARTRAHARRTTCENVMRVLRSNKESVTAMLEAFVHDPLINWRLLNAADATTELVRNTSEHTAAETAGGCGCGRALCVWVGGGDHVCEQRGAQGCWNHRCVNVEKGGERGLLLRVLLHTRAHACLRRRFSSCRFCTCMHLLPCPQP